jgi:excinuclease ABC subunit A
VAVGQNVLNRNPNSTVASASGLHLFLRMLYARFGLRSCPRCGTEVAVSSEDEIVSRLSTLAQQQKVEILAPLLRQASGSHRTLLQLLASQFGLQSILVDGQGWQGKPLDPEPRHSITIRLGQLPRGASASHARRVVRAASALGTSSLVADVDGQQLILSRAPACPECGNWFGELRPAHFATTCPFCDGAGCDRCMDTGLHPGAAVVRVAGLTLPNLLALPVADARDLFAADTLPVAAERLRLEITRRLEALHRVSLGYLSLDRPSPSLSRGEAQRMRLATCLTSRLEDLLHVFDEPTIGQHPADVAKLMPLLRELPGPVIYVEHDQLAASYADQAIDLGPGAGDEGGHLLFCGPPLDLWQQDTPTGRFFSLREQVKTPHHRPPAAEFLTVRGASLHNLRDINVSLPVGRLTVVTGVSGSGKSTLLEGVLVTSLRQARPCGCKAIEGPALRPILVDQGPIGRNPRSNPATYTKLSDIIRDLYATVTGLTASHFSFNRPEGACPACKGMGAVEVQMKYLPSMWIPCAACDGQRFSDEILWKRVVLGGQVLSIAELYRLSVAEALPLLRQETRLSPAQRKTAVRILRALSDVGLGYLQLGQPSPTLSGGEAQRVKLAKHLGRGGLSTRLLALDEPTTGLHPQDVAALLVVLDRLTRRGATIVVVEHNADVIRAADWVIDLGPSAGRAGGCVMYAGPPSQLEHQDSATGQALRNGRFTLPRAGSATVPPSHSDQIRVRHATAHNLKGIDVDFPKGKLTVVTGVSGSGKSSLVSDTLGAEARVRFLETLSLYERQSAQETSESGASSVEGLGVAITVGTERRLRYDWRATVGTASEISRHLAVLLSLLGERRCLDCGQMMERLPLSRIASLGAQATQQWQCPSCGAQAPAAEPRHFSSSTYAAACLACHGVGSLQSPRPEKLIVDADKPLCAGAMHSPGFFPKGYLCKPGNHGYDMTLALGERYGFDPQTTSWDEMSSQAQHAFLFGDPEPLTVSFDGSAGGRAANLVYPGFYGWIRDWDVGGLYTEREPCPECHGQRLRPPFLAVTAAGYNVHDLNQMPLQQLRQVLDNVAESANQGRPHSNWPVVQPSLAAASERLRFLTQVGLGYLHLDRLSATLSAGEAQRVRLAGLLGSALTSLTVLLDEPSRGLHPSELEALLAALLKLRDDGNTLIVVEHDPLLIQAADHLIDVGPGAGLNGGTVVAQGTPQQVAQADTTTALWLRGERTMALPAQRRQPREWMEIHGARENNLQGETVRLPLKLLVGVCGVSGSGKSTLLIDTLGRALAPRRLTTSVAYEPIEPGAHDSICRAPKRTVMVDQALAGMTTPADFLGLMQPLVRLYADSEDAQALGLTKEDLARRCSACGGRGIVSTDMGFLPTVHTDCEVCQGTGFLPEAWSVRVGGLTLPELLSLPIEQARQRLQAHPTLARPLAAAQQVGLGYLILRQPRHALSGGEAQRLRIVKELCRNSRTDTLYILDEPTVGQHLEDVQRLTAVLQALVERGHTVLVIEHHPQLLAACDWLLELGPGGGPDGGRIIAQGDPETIAAGNSPTAPYLRHAFEGRL